jgi:hypothetical protein
MLISDSRSHFAAISAKEYVWIIYDETGIVQDYNKCFVPDAGEVPYVDTIVPVPPDAHAHASHCDSSNVTTI